MSRHLALDGAKAVAEAMRQINPDVVAAYPITPQTEIVQTFSNFVADGLVDTEFVTVESEHSAMSACVGAAAAGARVMTATSSAGLALMWEILYVAASNRLPIVMPVVNRALSAPINIHCDHSDTMGARDAGWIQLFSETAQEAYDNAIQAPRIAEYADVLLPVMVCQDGFITSHGLERVDALEDEQVRQFVGTLQPHMPLLNLDHPVTYGPLDFYDYYFEHKRQQVEAMRHAGPAILEVADEFTKLSGRRYGYFEPYKLDDADVAVVVINSTAGTARVVADRLRQEGIKAGVLKIRVFRPFPVREFVEALGNVKVIGVMDRSDSFGAMGGPVFLETCAALYANGQRPLVKDFVYGLGGRDTPPDQIDAAFRDLIRIGETGQITELVTYLGVR
ncbi:MAG: pyruvate ferredoxin oxidoreductase [Chloroflexi bacterium]|nr:pyruvate ferredoxin oxidoreductase [Chloroflexota bacterium]MBU1746690.1 pyruvate ferredoxin oxidoreductase [Chloroflexota bacterium]MBU1878330.1 pyruvate ferredoxin oxidoreductase [Chloroflexota bacterium]